MGTMTNRRLIDVCVAVDIEERETNANFQSLAREQARGSVSTPILTSFLYVMCYSTGRPTPAPTM